jgi:hypothetical protein
MAELMLVNPRRKKRRSGGRRRKMSALQRQYFGGGRKRRRSRRRRVAALSAAPVATRRSRRRRVSVGRKRSRRRMGLGGGGGRAFSVAGIMRDIVPAGIGAAGALGVDIAMGYIRPMLPAGFSGPMIDPLIKIGGAIGVGYVAGQVMGRRFGEQVTAGALTVAMYDIIKGFVRQAAPGLVSEYVGEYDDQIGWISPAEQVGEYVGEYSNGNAYVPV